MTQDTRKRLPVWAVTLGLWAIAVPAGGQEAPGDQVYRFDFSQKFGVNDNLRLGAPSVGTTYYSDTALKFGFSSEAGPQKLDFSIGGVARVINDPLLGTDSGFRDPTLNLSYLRDTASSRLFLYLNYERPDLAFLDPLQRDEITDTDLYQGGGTREDYQAGVRLETGLQAPLGLVLDLNTNRSIYSNTTDPLLFENWTNSAAAAALFRFSPATLGRLDVSEDRYHGDDTSGTRVTTRRLTFGLEHEFSATTYLSADFGHSKVTETFTTLPGVENNTSGPVGALSLVRLMPNGRASMTLDTSLTQDGRQSNLQLGRVFELPAGGLEFRLGTSWGQSFDPRPIGLVDYVAELPRGSFNARLSREVSISDTLSQATETTRLNLGYSLDLSSLSTFSINTYYADISLIGNGVPPGSRQRGSFYATYSHDIARDWEFLVGYEYQYFNPNAGSSADSNSVFFTLQRNFEAFH